MQADKILEQRLLEKIRQLVPEKILLVESFIDFLYQQKEDVNLTLAATKLSELAFQKIWDNPDNVEYDIYNFGDVVKSYKRLQESGFL